MEHGLRLSRRARWAVPAGAVIAVGAVIAGTTVAGAQTTPSLPARSAAQLLTDVQHATGPGPMTATLQETANLGFPDLPSSDSASSGLSLLSGTHTFTVWYADPAHVRIAEQVQLGESDLRRDGRQVWLWDSTTQTATHLVLPALRRAAASSPAVSPPAAAGSSAAASAPTPQQVARQVLAAVGPTTMVSVQRNVTVAGQAAYQLAIAPKDSRSLIGQVKIAIDASKSFPLRVQVFARGAASPALQVGFTALSFGRPAASNFAFTPPHGAKVKTVVVPAAPPVLKSAAPKAAMLKSAAPKAAMVRIARPGRAGTTQQAPPGAVYSSRGSLYSLPSSGWYGYGPLTDGALMPAGLAGLARPTVMGKGWLSVLVLSPGTASGKFTISVPRAHSRVIVTSPSVTVARRGSKGPGAGPAGAGLPAAGLPGIAGALLKSATPVHGAWGSGRLLRTSLVSVLVTSDGTVLAGAVTPSVLYADAAAVK